MTIFVQISILNIVSKWWVRFDYNFMHNAVLFYWRFFETNIFFIFKIITLIKSELRFLVYLYLVLELLIAIENISNIFKFIYPMTFLMRVVLGSLKGFCHFKITIQFTVSICNDPLFCLHYILLIQISTSLEIYF